MKLISRPTHGVIDYVAAGSLLPLPFLLKSSPKARNVFLGLAAGHALYSMLTKYEVGLVKKIPFKGHMVLDGLFALGWIAAAAAMTNESKAVRGTMAAIAASEIAAMAMTDPEASSQKEALSK
jgi:hypothetical protein